MPASSNPDSEQREELAAADSRSPSTIVLTRPQGSANFGYAYHEVREEGEPLCNAGSPDDEFMEVTISEAQRRNKSPCQMCERIRD